MPAKKEKSLPQITVRNDIKIDHVYSFTDTTCVALKNTVGLSFPLDTYFLNKVPLLIFYVLLY